VGDLLNLIRKERKSGLAAKFQFVELDDPAREYRVEEDGELSVDEQVAPTYVGRFGLDWQAF